MFSTISFSIQFEKIYKNDSGTYSCKSDENIWSNITLTVQTNNDLYLNSPAKLIKLKKKSISDEESDSEKYYNVAAHILNKEELHKIINKSIGAGVKIKCPAAGFPEPNITWTKDYEIIDRRLSRISFGRWNIFMDDLNVHDSGVYICTVCNFLGCDRFPTIIQVRDDFASNMEIESQFSESRTLEEERTELEENEENDDDYNEKEETTVISVRGDGKTPVAPIIKKIKLKKIIAKPSGNYMKYNCRAGGYPEPNITWTVNNHTIQRTMGDVRYNKFNIILEELGEDDTGNYECRVCNYLGCDSFEFRLIVTGKFFLFY